MPSPNSADTPPPAPSESANFRLQLKMELAGIGVLALMVVYFLAISWRKWPDPIVDFGPQCYSVWRLSQGASLYHDFIWNYGPVSIYFNAVLFRIFGPGIMVLVTANLLIYALILSLAYFALRRTWGWMAAFAASAVFISVFSFSHLLGVGNYNYATPYAGESTHGMLLVLVAMLVVAKWYRAPSCGLAFVLGMCGGLSAVLKPEFMLAMGVLGIAALGLRFWHRQRVTVAEFALLLAGVVLPTAAFTLWFAGKESWSDAFIDASQAWWLVVVEHIQNQSGQQSNFSGFDHPWMNAMMEVKATGGALLIMALAWAAGWTANQPWSALVRTVTPLACFALMWQFWKYAGWLTVGRCLPGMMAVLLMLVVRRLFRERRELGKAKAETAMALLLILLAGAMLARMPLFARVFHLGFFQAALAAMVVAAAMVAELPRRVGQGMVGRVVTLTACALTLALYCAPFALKSRWIRADQTEPVGWGADRFYSTTRKIDGTGALVNWAADKLRSTPPDSTVMVFPEGEMINYLARRRSMEPGWERRGNDITMLEQMERKPPDFVVLITRDISEFGLARFGTPGNFGYEIIKWVADRYVIAGKLGGDPLAADGPPGAIILRRKPTDDASAPHSPTR